MIPPQFQKGYKKKGDFAPPGDNPVGPSDTGKASKGLAPNPHNRTMAQLKAIEHKLEILIANSPPGPAHDQYVASERKTELQQGKKKHD